MTRAAAIRHGRADRAAAVAALMAAGVLAGCAPGAGQGPEAIELANIAEPNIVPKSSPAQFARAFERFCLDTPAEARAETLRAADYVPFAPVRASSRVRTFVVDDRRPAVMLAGEGDCAVAAEARTGQSARVARLVAARFPAARPVEPARLGPNVEAAWLSRSGGPVILTLRQLRPGHPSRYTLALVQTD
ncbi:MAG: hypothetical protein ACO38S_08740 [Gemmobacter sp.]|jgi:hypothetical protein